MPRNNHPRNRRRQQQPKRERRISVRAVQRDQPDVRKLARAVIALAMAQAEADAQAEAIDAQRSGTEEESDD